MEFSWVFDYRQTTFKEFIHYFHIEKKEKYFSFENSSKAHTASIL